MGTVIYIPAVIIYALTPRAGTGLMAGRLLSFRMRTFRRGRTEEADDYAGVLIPLTEAHLHSHSARIGRCEFESLPQDDEEDADDAASKDSERESQGMLEEMTPAEYTIEGLRREVKRGGKGQWTDYECEFLLPAVVKTS